MRTAACVCVCLLLATVCTGQEGPDPKASDRFDGSNVLPNPGLELAGEAGDQPDSWRGGDWRTGSKVARDTSVARTGEASVRIECETDQQRGSYALRPPVGPGPWLFEAWYRTEQMKAPYRCTPAVAMRPRASR